MLSWSCDRDAKKCETFVGSWEFDATVGKFALNLVGRLCANKLVASETQDLVHYRESLSRITFCTCIVISQNFNHAGTSLRTINRMVALDIYSLFSCVKTYIPADVGALAASHGPWRYGERQSLEALRPAE